MKVEFHRCTVSDISGYSSVAHARDFHLVSITITINNHPVFADNNASRGIYKDVNETRSVQGRGRGRGYKVEAEVKCTL